MAAARRGTGQIARFSRAIIAVPSFQRFGLVPQRIHFGERGARAALFRARRARARLRRSGVRICGWSAAAPLPGRRRRWRARLTAANSRSPTSAGGLRLLRLGASSSASISSASSRIFAQHGARIVPVEADLAGLGLQFERAGQGRERHRHAGERAAVSGRAATRRALAFSSALMRSHTPSTACGSARARRQTRRRKHGDGGG